MESKRRAFLAGLGGLAGGSLLLWTVRRELSVPSALVSADSNSGPLKIVQFDDAGKKLGVVTLTKVVKTDEEWRKLLDPEQYRVTRHAGTERCAAAVFAPVGEATCCSTDAPPGLSWSFCA